jgi:glutaredoxin-dependent peroxiredoxin
MTTPATAAHVPVAGEPAPDFSLKSTSGQQVALADFRGKQHVLLAFFPLAFTSTCTAEMCAFTEDFDDFASRDVVVLPVSVDAVPSLKEFRKQQDMKTELLSDFKREASRAYGVLNEESFHSRRAYFLIDRRGIVRWSHVEDKAGVRRENREILEQIAKLS